MGYHRAGFDVVGVDIKPQPRYPFTFHQADALTFPTDGFDAIHASPPCQGYSRMRHLPWLKNRVYPLLLTPVRELLKNAGVPWVIENVEDAPMAKHSTLFGDHGVLLCGSMFGIEGLYRHRRFESSFPLPQREHPTHDFVMATGGASLAKRYRGHGVAGVRGISAWQAAGVIGGHMGNMDRARRIMGVDWMRADELRESIPPAYTEYIGAALIKAVERHATTGPTP